MAKMDTLQPGDVMRHSSGGLVVLRGRKDDDSGWRCTDGSGLSDDAIANAGWEKVGAIGSPCPTCGTRLK